MSHRLWTVIVCAVSFLTIATLAQGQSVIDLGGLAPGASHHPVYQRSSAYQDEGSSSRYVYAPTPKAQNSSQQQSNEAQAQGQNGNQAQGMNPTPNQTQGMNPTQNPTQNNQGQAKEDTPPEKPQYLTYSAQKKSLEEQTKTGKTLAVDFKSAPTGATITVDGYFVGRTPATAQIPVGKHLVSVTKWGYDTWSKELDVNTGKDLSVNPKLHKDW